MLVHKITGIPWVAFAHGQTTENTKMRLYSWIDKFAMKYADRVVAVSKGLYEHQLKPAGIRQTKVRIVHNAIDADSIKPTVFREQMRKNLGLTQDNFVVGVIGRFSPEKGQDIFLKAFAQSCSHGTNARVLFVGDGPEIDRAKSLACDLGVNGKVTFLGYRDDIPNLYQVIDLVVIPSRSEGLPNVLLEALALGKAVIATDVGGIAEVIEHRVNGILIPANDINSLSHAINDVYVDKELFNCISGNAQQSVQIKFSTEARARNIYSVYQELFSER
jgi:glycosyltransferase involved in cell wall biosynthesis